MADSDSDWRRWGEREPYYGVLSDPRFRAASFEESREDFFTGGRLAVEERLTAAERELGPFARDRAFEFGCGVGRLALPLADHFGEVVALDVAPAMLDEARRNADAAGMENLDFALSDDALSGAPGAFDFVLSWLVFQHIPMRRGMAILPRLFEKVAPGGILSLQLCIDRHDTASSSARYWAQRHVPGMRQLLNLTGGRPLNEPLMQMNAYPLDDVLAMAKAAGFGPAHVERALHGRFEGVQLLMRRVEGGAGCDVDGMGSGGKTGAP